MGLKERIQSATTSKEVDSLLKKGKGYKDAPEVTKRRWEKAREEALGRINKEQNNPKKKEKTSGNNS
jgi:hypothetical protein